MGGVRLELGGQRGETCLIEYSRCLGCRSKNSSETMSWAKEKEGGLWMPMFTYLRLDYSSWSLVALAGDCDYLRAHFVYL